MIYVYIYTVIYVSLMNLTDYGNVFFYCYLRAIFFFFFEC